MSKQYFRIGSTYICAPNIYLAERIVQESELDDRLGIEPATKDEIKLIESGNLKLYNEDAIPPSADLILEYFNRFLKDVSVEYDDPDNTEVKQIKEISWDPYTYEPYVELTDGTWAHLPFIFISKEQ